MPKKLLRSIIKHRLSFAVFGGIALIVLGSSAAVYGAQHGLMTTTHVGANIIAKTAAVAKPSTAPVSTPKTVASSASSPKASTAPVVTKTSSVSAPVAAAAVSSVTAAPSTTVNSLAPTASTSSTTPATAQTQTPAPTPVQTTQHYSSSNWSGYAALSGTFTAVSGSWTVPTPTPTSTTAESIDGAWIGIGGVSSNDLIQTGTADIVEPDGSITSAAFYELLPANAVYLTSISIQPGDAITAAIAQSSPGVWSVNLSDQTNGQSFSTTVSYTSSYSSAEWIEEDPSYSDGSLAPLDNFGTINFTDAMANTGNGLQLADVFNPASITLVAHHQAVATPSALSNGAFSVTHS